MELEMTRRCALWVMLGCAVGAASCGSGHGEMMSSSPEVIWRGHPIGLALFETTIAIADTRDNVIVVERGGELVGRFPARSNAFDTSGSGGDLLIFSSDGSELAWVEYLNGSAVLRVMTLATREVRDLPAGLPAVPRVAQLVWNDGYHLVSEDGGRRFVTREGVVSERASLGFGGKLAFADGDEWRVQRDGRGVALHGRGSVAPTVLSISGAVMDVEARDGWLAIITTGEPGMGDDPVPKLFLIELGSAPKLSNAISFKRSSEGPYRLAWTQSYVLVLMAEGEVRGYGVSTGDLRYTVEVGAPNAAGLAVSDGTLLVRTAEDVRRLRLPGT